MNDNCTLVQLEGDDGEERVSHDDQNEANEQQKNTEEEEEVFIDAEEEKQNLSCFERFRR